MQGLLGLLLHGSGTGSRWRSLLVLLLLLRWLRLRLWWLLLLSLGLSLRLRLLLLAGGSRHGRMGSRAGVLSADLKQRLNGTDPLLFALLILQPQSHKSASL